MKVETKLMAFEDSTATAPDRLNGQKNLVAFRAFNLRNGGTGTTDHQYSEKGIFIYIAMNYYNELLQ